MGHPGCQKTHKTTTFSTFLYEEKLHLQLEGQHLAMHLELQTLQRRLKLHSDKVQTKQEAAGLKQVEGMIFFTLKTPLEIGGEDNTYPK